MGKTPPETEARYPDVFDLRAQQEWQDKDSETPSYWIKNQQPPAGLLYHYTTLDAFTKILSSSCLWASGVRYLNDSQEITAGLDHLSETVTKRTAERSQDKILSQVYKVISSRLRSARGILSSSGPTEAAPLDYYVTCFSDDGGDRLSQWRAYGGVGAGAAIGFDSEALRLLRPKAGLARLVQTIYDDSVARPHTAKFLDQLESVALKKADGAAEPETAVIPAAWMLFGTLIDEVTTRVKHEAFREEREWRVAVTPKDEQPIQVRASNEGLIPYVEISVPDGPYFLPIAEIMVGPSSRQELNVLAINTLLKNRGYPASIQVRSSKVPFRT